MAADPGHDLRDPAVSPDGTLVAATRAPGDIAIYSAATAQLVRVVSSGPSDSGPTWSPDGRSIAFARGGGGLWVVSATGAPGSERRILASGIQPVWVRGGGAALRLTGPKRARAGSACGSGWPARRAARACACSAGRPPLAHARDAHGGRVGDDVQAAAAPRSRRAAGAGPRARRRDERVAVAPRAGAVAPANVNGGIEGAGSDRRCRHECRLDPRMRG